MKSEIVLLLSAGNVMRDHATHVGSVTLPTIIFTECNLGSNSGT